MSKALEEIIAAPSLVREQWLSPELAVQEVLAFERRFGSKHLMLACHAALPLILTPELLNLIHINFWEKEQIPWVAEVDFLLSPLCRPIDEGLFEVEPSVREVLLVELENQFGWERPFDLAKFLSVYLTKKNDRKQWSEVRRTQEWIAQAYLNADSLIEKITDSLEDHLFSLPGQIQLVTVLELLAEPLERANRVTEYQHLVINSRFLAQMLYGDEEALRHKIQQEPVEREIAERLLSPIIFRKLAGIDFRVQFWGVRDLIPCSGPETIRYGGNTSCVEVRLGNQRLIFDGGTGLRVLGDNLLEQMPVEAHIFYTNCHYSSLQGITHFMAGFVPGNCFHIYGAIGSNGASIEYSLKKLMYAPNFPVPIQVMKSKLKFYDLTFGEKISIGDATVETALLNSSHHSMGYRVTWQGHSVVYATNRSSYPDHIDNNLLQLAHQADLLILDAPRAISANDLRASSPLNWQDELWQTGITTAKAAGVKQVVLSRYHPDHDDDFLNKVEKQIQLIFPNSLLAREGMILQVL